MVAGGREQVTLASGDVRADLSAADLQQRLQSLAAITRRGSRPWRLVGWWFLLAGALGALYFRRALALGYAEPWGGWLAEFAALALLIGLALTVTFAFFPARRAFEVPVLDRRAQQWQRIEGAWFVNRLARGLALALMAVGVVYVYLTYGYSAASDLTNRLLIGAAMLGVGAFTYLLAAARREPLQQLYIHLWLLTQLESRGQDKTSTDPRVGTVLLALDRLLGSLPEAEVQAFLASPEAQDYLDVLAKYGPPEA